MLIKRWQRKIEDLRQEPQPVRMRAALLMTGVSGLVLGALWLTILLPLQLRLGDTEENVAQETEPPTALIGGIQDRTLSTPSPSGLLESYPQLEPLPLTSPSPSPVTTSLSLPVEIEP